MCIRNNSAGINYHYQDNLILAANALFYSTAHVIEMSYKEEQLILQGSILRPPYQ